MTKTVLLLKTQALNTFRIYEVLHGDKKRKTPTIIMLVGISVLVAYFIGYNVVTALSLVKMGATEIIPAFMVAIPSFAIFIFTMFRSNSLLFGNADFYMLSALPLKNSTIVHSKFLFVYIMNLSLAMIIIIPSAIIWYIATGNLLYFILYLVTSLIIPLIPMTAALTISIIIALISSKLKKSNIVYMTLSLLTLIGLMLLGNVANFGTAISGTEGSDVILMLTQQVTNMYPLSELFIAINYQVFLFIIASFVVYGIFFTIVSKNYVYLYHLVSFIQRNNSKSKEKIKKKSLFVALYQKELKRFFSLSVYVINSGFGIILLILLSIVILVLSPEKIYQLLGVPNMDSLVSNYAGIIVAALIALSCTSASALSLEGKSVWIVQSTPIKISTLMLSKIAVNVTVHVVGIIFAIIALLFSIQMSVINIILLIILPLSYSFFVSVLGLCLNTLLPNFKWDSEMTVIKQSTPIIVSLFVAMLTIALPVALTLVFSLNISLVFIATVVVLNILTLILYKKTISFKFA